MALLNRLSFPSRGTVIPVAFVKKPSGPATDRRWDLHRQLRLSTQQGRKAHIEGGYRLKTNTSPNRKGTTRPCWEIRGLMCSFSYVEQHATLWHPFFVVVKGLKVWLAWSSCLPNSQFGGLEPTKAVSALKIKPDPLLHVFYWLLTLSDQMKP